MKRPHTLPFSIESRGRLHEFVRPAVAGILNVTPDSFYDGGRYRTADAIVQRAHEIVAQGADMIDIGAASSRPGAVLPPPEEEAARLAEAVRLVRAALPEALISVDTCYALPARKAVEAGADMVNDIGGGDTDKEMFATVAELQVPYILMHGGKEHLTGVKRMIYTTLGTTADEALGGTVALDTLALDRGAAALRVHDVKPAVETVNLLYRR